ncbi:hypothetical protein CEXT_590881 [Caerostris extrusa]|uniref:Uncharacterized protein n=1 Tax=Caerostris extrusa TaxID=172846 RepID=A0AAV4RWH5_CAEEX|nr:hypothetical protein CEXT_590881 [Caerostris extrusa]
MLLRTRKYIEISFKNYFAVASTKYLTYDNLRRRKLEQFESVLGGDLITRMENNFMTQSSSTDRRKSFSTPLLQIETPLPSPKEN